MNESERWLELERLYHAALERPPEERASFIEEACADGWLRREVESLLAHDHPDDAFLDQPAMDIAARELAVNVPSPGTVVGNYRLGARIAAGGMGIVFEAEDLHLHRRVAVKILPPSFAAEGEERIQRFQREARAASLLNHPNIVSIYDAQFSRALSYIAMEYVEGRTLRQFIASESQAISTGTVLDIIGQTAAALSAAHEAGIVHRDIKPENIIVRPDGFIKVLDFGLARVDGPAGKTLHGTPLLSRPGHLAGTIHYIAPEQVLGKPASPRSDLFSLGVVAYELAVGVSPFDGPTDGAVFDAILNRTPAAPSTVRPSAELLDAMILKALEKDPELRFQTAADLRVCCKLLARDPAVDSFSAGGPRTGSSRSLPGNASADRPYAASSSHSSDSQMIMGLIGRHRVSATLFLAAGLVLAVVAAYLVYRPSSAVPPRSAPVEFARVTGSGDVQQADISPDGKFVAYVRGTAGQQSLWLKQLTTGSDVQIATLGEDQCPGIAFSPDGSYVYFVRQGPLNPSGELYQIPALGGTPRRILSGISGEPALAPDGLRVAFVRSTLITNGLDTAMTAYLDGSGEQALASYTAPGIQLNRIAWSPDGKSLVYPIHGSTLTVIPAHGGTARPAPGGVWKNIEDLAPVPGTNELVIAAAPGPSTISQIYEYSLDHGEKRQITRGLSYYTRVRSTGDGKTLLAIQDQTLSTIQVVTPGRESQARTSSQENQNLDGHNGVAWTPDGKILYTSTSGEHNELREMRADGSAVQQVTHADAFTDTGRPAVAPGGGFIVFNTWKGDDAFLWRIDSNGDNLIHLTDGVHDAAPSISPDEKWVVFDRGQGDKAVLMKVPATGGRATQLTGYDSVQPSISPDGKWIACFYTPGLNEPTSLAIVPFAGGKPAKVFPLPPTAGIEVLAWTRDGHAVTFVNSLSGVSNIWEQPLDGGQPKPVTHFTSDTIFHFDWSRDGQLAVSRGPELRDAVLIRNFR